MTWEFPVKEDLLMFVCILVKKNSKVVAKCGLSLLKGLYLCYKSEEGKVKINAHS